MPVIRVNDIEASGTGISVLRPFPRAHGIQVFVHSNDHPPPHIHVQAPAGGQETRYLWPDLRPMDRDQPLSSAAEKGLKRYLEVHWVEIDRRVRAFYER